MPNVKKRSSRSSGGSKPPARSLPHRNQAPRAKSKVPTVQIQAIQNIQEVNVGDLKPAPYNPRTISDAALAGLTASMKRFGVVEPIIWNRRTGFVVGGHQRLAVLRNEGVERVQVVAVDLEEKEERQLNIALNNLSGEWNWESLKTLLNDIQPSEEDRVLLGFGERELAALLQWGQDAAGLPGGSMDTDSGVGSSPDDKLATYQNNQIKQIVLYFPTEEYIKVLSVMKGISDSQSPKLETHSHVFMHLIDFYEKNSRSKKKS